MKLDFTYAPTGTDFSTLTVNERRNAKPLIEAASYWATRAQLWLRGYAKSPVGVNDAAMGPFRRWFGYAGTNQVKKMQSDFKKLAGLYSRKVRVYKEDEDGVYAYVMVGNYDHLSNKTLDICLCNEFWNNFVGVSAGTGMTAEETKIGTIVHEASHKVLYTEDFAYELTNCQELAKYRATAARANADNVMYFAWEFRDKRNPPTKGGRCRDGTETSDLRYRGPRHSACPSDAFTMGATPHNYAVANLPDLNNCDGAPTTWTYIDIDECNNQGYISGDIRPA